MATTEAFSASANSETVIAEQLDYHQKKFAHPTYKYNAQFSNTFGQAINLGVSNMPVTINIPPEVMNMSQAYITYSVTLPGVTARFIWYHFQALREISQIQWYSGSNMYMVDINNLQNYLDITIKRETSRDDFLSLDPLLNEVGPSNSLINAVPAYRNSNVTLGNVPNGPPNSASINYTEPGYFGVGGLSQDVTYKVQFPLRLIKNSMFSCDKDFYFGQTTYLKIYFGPLSKICYTSSLANNPSGGAKLPYAGGDSVALNANNNARITDFQLMLPIETNEEIRTMLINKVATIGLSYMIPYVQAFKNSNIGGSQNITIQFDIGNGRYLEKVYHSIYNNQEDLDTAYDHSNNQTVAGFTSSAVNQKIYQYYTSLNGKRQQDITLDCTYTGGFLDYLQHRRQLRGSILSNLDVFHYNWAHADDYCQFSSEYDQQNSGSLISGLPMNIAPITWAFVGLSMRAIAFQHYTWAVFVKQMKRSERC